VVLRLLEAMMRDLYRIVCLSLLSTVVAAQAATITEPRVREVVGWLAADERKGRASGSPELAAAGDWLADRFQKAGLKQLREGSWFHEFGLAANRVDSDAVELQLTCRVHGNEQKVELVAGRDVRQWLPTDGLKGEESCTVAPVADAVLQRLLSVRAARRPIIIEVAEHDAFWLAAKGQHTVLGERRMAARPVLLVRKGVLPDVSADQDVEWTANWSVAAAERTEVAQRNVMALLPARADSDRKGEYIVVSAHYDHIGVGPAKDGDAINNGADDDATGTTAVVLLAEALAKMPAPRRNILFVCFAAEERGLEGSKAFCAQPPLPLDQIVANINIEMIGRPAEGNEGKAWVTGAPFSDFASICDQALQKSGSGLVEFAMADRLFAASDNFSFVSKGVVAHSISAGSLHRDYHQPGDEVDKLNIPHMTNIIRGLLDVTLAFADRDQSPAWNEKGEEFLKKLQR
jgi:hypothetical protein